MSHSNHGLVCVLSQNPLDPCPSSEHLNYFDISTVRTPKDGNCLFSSVAIAHLADMTYAPALRSRTADYVFSHWRDFAPFASIPNSPAPPTAGQYANYMSRPSCYAGECEIVALSKLLNVNIVVHTMKRVLYYFAPKPRHTVYLKYFGDHSSVGHYEPFHPAAQHRQAPPRPASPPDEVQVSNLPPPLPPRYIPPLLSPHRAVRPPGRPAVAMRSPPISRNTNKQVSRTGRVPSPPTIPPFPFAHPNRFAPLAVSTDTHISEALTDPTPGPPHALPPALPPRPCSSPKHTRRVSFRPPPPLSPQMATSAAMIPTLFPQPPKHMRWQVPVVIFTYPTHALLDCGSSFSLCSSDLVPPHHIDSSSPTPILRTAKGDPVDIIGVVTTKVTCGTLTVPHQFFICDSLAHQVILGLTWLYQTKSVLDFANDAYTLSVGSTKFEHYLSPPQSTAQPEIANIFEEFKDLSIDEVYTCDRRVCATSDTCIPPRRLTRIHFSVSPLPFTSHGLFKLNQRLANLLSAPALDYLIDPNSTFITLYNMTDESVQLSAGQSLGRLSSADEPLACMLSSRLASPSALRQPCAPDGWATSLAPEPGEQPACAPCPSSLPPAHDRAEICVPPRPDPNDSLPKQHDFDVNTDLPPADYLALTNLLNEFSDIFVTNLGDITKECTYTARLPLREGHTVTYVPQFKLSPKEMEYAKAYVAELVRCNVAVKKKSPFNNPFFMILKKKEKESDPDSYRFLISMKAINASVIKRSNFHLPSVTELLSRLAFKNYFFRSDICSAFFQIPLAEESQQLTCFRVGTESYCLRRMP